MFRILLILLVCVAGCQPREDKYGDTILQRNNNIAKIVAAYGVGDGVVYVLEGITTKDRITVKINRHKISWRESPQYVVGDIVQIIYENDDNNIKRPAMNLIRGNTDAPLAHPETSQR